MISFPLQACLTSSLPTLRRRVVLLLPFAFRWQLARSLLFWWGCYVCPTVDPLLAVVVSHPPLVSFVVTICLL